VGDKNKVIEWFKKEGAISQDGNLYLAARAFVANSIVVWAKEQASTLKQQEIDYIMKTLRLFLQGNINLRWSEGNIEIVGSQDKIQTPSSLETQTKGT
tara:strand:- start:184 stop:477 length:294 start_codon:yes stop_codon:yes gene_type:complete